MEGRRDRPAGSGRDSGVRVWRTGGITISLVDYPAGLTMRPHEHPTLGVSIVLRGAVEEVVGRTTEQAGVASVVVKPAGVRHANRFGPAGALLLGLEVERVHLEALAGGERLLEQWRWMEAATVFRVAVGLLAELQDRTCADAGAPEDAAVDLLEALTTDEPPRRATPPRWLLATRDQLRAEHREPCRVSVLAAEAGVHPVYLARCFRRHFGCSIRQYLRWLRVRTAASAIGDRRAGLAAIAGETGFADQSHLTRAFRSGLGITPRAFRSLVRTGR